MIIAIKYLLCTVYRIKVLDIRDIRHHIALKIFRIGASTFYSFKITIRNLKFLTFESQLLDNVVGGSGVGKYISTCPVVGAPGVKLIFIISANSLAKSGNF